ncbi:hypothetical protein IV203_024421 [Nitzschia inconspicua]|uniref:Uncharacterized protein n=1 Tax=Nitzschia inconspicua TaxID=303405 RepID=A0A9K3KDD0_9STRA|nr:hypothetical protein IV203_024421 [Nitzschia inconspicua]
MMKSIAVIPNKAITSSTTSVTIIRCLLLLVAVNTWTGAGAFMTPSTNAAVMQQQQRQHVLKMADEPMPRDQLGPTERLLLERKRIQDLGLVQELGKTVKKDGLDGIRSVVWAVYNASNIVFPILAVIMFAGICLNLMGYGYYWEDTTNQLIIDSLEHIRQENIYQQELLRIASEATTHHAGFF